MTEFENYTVTQNGEVISFWTSKGHVLKTSLTRGYQRVTLYNDLGRKTFLVHRLVMAAYVGPSDRKINHINGDKTDNRIENLEYVK